MAAGSSPQPESPELEATLLGAGCCRRSLPALLLLPWALRSHKQQQLQGRVAAAPWQLRWFSCAHLIAPKLLIPPPCSPPLPLGVPSDNSHGEIWLQFLM